MFRIPWRSWLAHAAIVLLFMLAIALWQNQDLPDGKAPWIEGVTLDGHRIRSGFDQPLVAGQPTLVVFWASACAVCRFEETSLAALAREWPTITVAIHSGSEEELRRYLTARGLALPTLADPHGEIARTWRIKATPTHFILDAHGNIRFRAVGYTPAWSLRMRLWWASFSSP
ncbi:MAG: redoxin domain-containing protein [Rhodocyclaceae bacterium]|nr:redoxin domain-containing protein [Rhodocyclaceae bacterium]